MNNTPSGAEKYRKSIEIESRQIAKMFTFFFRQASSNLCDSLTMVFAQDSSIFHQAVNQPIALLQI